jgi:hypothetical protein
MPLNIPTLRDLEFAYYGGGASAQYAALLAFNSAGVTFAEVLEAAQAVANGDFATLQDVSDAIAALVDSAPEALDTLNELAAALNNDEEFATTVTNALAGKVATASGITVVEHGSTASTARPSGAAVVYWIGSVEPTNGENQDLWYDTTGDS